MCFSLLNYSYLSLPNALKLGRATCVYIQKEQYKPSTYKRNNMKMKSSQMFFFVELFILVFYVHEHICSEVFLRLNVRHHVTSQRKPNTAKHTSQQQTIRTDHHPGHSYSMAVTANTPPRGDRPPPRRKTDSETMAKGGKGRNKRCASDGGNTADKSHKRSSAEGDNDKSKRMTATDVRDKSSTKGDGATTPHDHDAETNLQKDPRPSPHEKNDQESMDKVTKGEKKRSASYSGNMGDKSRKRSSAEGYNDK